MGDYESKPETVLPQRPLPPEPKPLAKKKEAPRRVPRTADVIAPDHEIDTVGMSSKTLLEMVKVHVETIHQHLGASKAAAIARLHDPPEPKDRSRALRILSFLAETLGTVVMGRISSGIVTELTPKAGEQGLTSDALSTIKDQLRSVTNTVGTGAAGLATSIYNDNTAGPPMANPSSKSLLDEFSTLLDYKLSAANDRAHGHLIAAMASVDETRAAEVQPLLDAVRRYSASPALGAWLQAEIALGWMNFSASVSLGARKPGESVMPEANKIGGSKSPDWRRQHQGFMEIDIDFPDYIDRFKGVTLGAVSILSMGPGAADILRSYTEATPGGDARSLSLATLPVYRRLWLGRNRTDRAPDVVITPDQHVEVNANSSLLAAIVSDTSGTFEEIQFRGRNTREENDALVAKSQRKEPSYSGEDGPLGPVLATPLPSLLPRDHVRLRETTRDLVVNARQASAGAELIIGALLAGATTASISK